MRAVGVLARTVDDDPKRPPVDTVALKKRIADDATKLGDRAALAGQLDAKGMKPQGDAAMSGTFDIMQRLVARQDSLEDARKPKTPVKKQP